MIVNIFIKLFIAENFKAFIKMTMNEGKKDFLGLIYRIKNPKDVLQQNKIQINYNIKFIYSFDLLFEKLKIWFLNQITEISKTNNNVLLII